MSRPRVSLCLLTVLTASLGSACAVPTAPGDSATDTDSGSSGAEGTGETGALPDPDPVLFTVFEQVIFYDGYAGVVDEPVAEGVIRHRNDLYGIKLTDEQLDSVQSNLHMQVRIGALCDNYDRIGSVFLALVPKGDATYVPAEVTRFEVARFITPFMNMNRPPTIVPFDFDVDELVPMLKDDTLRAEFDIWMELSVFGVPYAANTEISGCEGRNDTSQGNVTLASDSTTEAPDFDFTNSLAVVEAFNNYQDGASDMIGTTRKTINFDLESNTDATRLVLITSNHGANSGGEEYIRRDHFVWVDGEPTYMYKPGRDTCEPFRMYNTQGNGIYGPVPMTDAEWQSFSNWCPGDVIDTRIIPLGAMTAGTHEFVIDVPDAQFAGGEGNFPFSLYVQGRSAG